LLVRCKNSLFSFNVLTEQQAYNSHQLHWLDVLQRVQFNMCATKGTTLHDWVLHSDMRHCSSAAPAIHRLPQSPAARTAPPAFDVRPSSLLCGRPGGLELTTGYYMVLRQFSRFTIAKAYSALKALRLCAIEI